MCRGDLDLITQLKAGSLLYYREGAAATISVKRLTGTLSLAIDGKTDASNRSDMLTQRVIAHLPLLLHENPRTVFIIGMGSGVTLGSALPASGRARRRGRDLARGRRSVAAISRRRITTRSPIHAPASSSATAASHLATDDREVRRDRVGAVEPVDRRRRRALHARVLRGGARPPGAGRCHLSVGEHLQHQRSRPALDCRDLHVGVSPWNGLAGRRERRAVRGGGRAARAPDGSHRARLGERWDRRRPRRCRRGRAVRAVVALRRRSRRAGPLRRRRRHPGRRSNAARVLGAARGSRKRGAGKCLDSSVACSPTRTVQARSELRSSKRRPPSGATAAR